MSLSKLAAARTLSSFTRNRVRTLPLVNFSQLRRLQTFEKMHDVNRKVNFFEGASGVYDIPNYKLDVVPYNIEGKNWRFWSIDNPALVLIFGIGCLTLFFTVCSLMWLTFFDPQVTLRRDNLYPYLQIKSGADYDKIRVPWLTFQWIRGNGAYDIRDLFYNEIEDAIERRKKIDEYLRQKQ